MPNVLLSLYLFLFAATLTAQEKGATPLAQSSIVNPISSTTRAVVIGISDYQDKDIPDLRFADRDAEAFANFLRSPAGGSLDGDHLKLLTNQGATIAQFDAALGWLMDESKEGDQAIIYFSGHGDVETKTRSQQGFLLCWDSPPQAYVSGAYPIFFLKEVVSTLSLENKARVIVITDACRSGKLAGNAVGGSQLTSQNLAQQFASEIKILSCQPNEYSIEGEQWGGGRGAFSYHLVDGLYGMADGNADASVNLMEIGRYLDDHVTTEVAPHSQVPMTVGNRTEKLAAVFPDLLAQVKKNKAGQLPTFSPTDARGIEEDVLATVDTTVRELYKMFKKALKDKVFLEPAGACADAYYERLIAEPKMERLHNAMRRNYAAALQDDAQQAVNNLMKMEKTEVRLYRLERLKKYAPYPRLLERAAELLSSEHYMYPTLQGRKCYFEGQVLQMESSVNADSVLGRRLLDKYRESLRWQQDAAVTWFAMSFVFDKIMPDADSMIWYAERAIERAPGWVRAYTLTANFLVYKRQRFEAARQLIDRALAVDSMSTYPWGSLGLWEAYANGNWKAGEQYLLKSISLDSTYSWAYGTLGGLYFMQNQTIKAEQALLKATNIDQPFPSTISFLGCLHYNVGEYEAAELYFKKAVEIEPDANNLRLMAGVHFGLNRPEQAEASIQNSLMQDSSAASLGLIGEIYADFGYYAKAETFFIKEISRDSSAYLGWSFLGWLYVKSGHYEEAVPNCRKAIELYPHDLFTWCDLGQAYQHLGYQEEARNTYLEIQKINSESPFGFIGLASLAAVDGNPEEALGLVEQAIQRGYSFEELKKSEFKNLEGFGELMKKYFPGQVKD